MHNFSVNLLSVQGLSHKLPSFPAEAPGLTAGGVQSSGLGVGDAGELPTAPGRGQGTQHGACQNKRNGKSQINALST